MDEWEEEEEEEDEGAMFGFLVRVALAHIYIRT